MFSVIGYGIWKTSGSKDMKSYLLGGNEAKWWTVGLSVMATQASAITFLSTPGQAYNDGMEFIQFYFTLPIALIIICVTFIPIYYKLKVYTAYEFLENRFDYKTRGLTSFLFLIQRGLATGITIYAPAIILSAVMGWNLNLTTLFIGAIAIIYTVIGGTKAVHVTHKLQMIIILIGLFVIFGILLQYITNEYSVKDIFTIAGASDKLDIIDTKFDWDDKYNIWACMIAAPFLFLSYFGTDQSQVQRYISGESVEQSQKGLIMNAFLKLPLQFFILFLGVLVFVFFQFNKSPIFFHDVSKEIDSSRYTHLAEGLNDRLEENFEKKKLMDREYVNSFNSQDAAAIEKDKLALSQLLDQEKKYRDQYKVLIDWTNEDNNSAGLGIKEIEKNDKDYIFIHFILNYLPKGLIGLLLAMIFFAAMSSTASELNALASTTTVDIYKRIIMPNGSDQHYLLMGKVWTLVWGLVAILFASIGTLFENLIQFVNIVGSIFYGPILGIFLVAFYFKKINGTTVFISALLVQLLIFYLFYEDFFSFLWLNLVGGLGVIIVSHLLKPFFKDTVRS